MEDDVRALEREVATHGEPSARLRLARALERAGRKDDAFQALVATADEAAVRDELARFPAWTHVVGGHAGRTSWIDVNPLRRPPRIRWCTTLQARCHGFAVSALGLVALLIEPTDEWEETSSMLTGLDPNSGAVRWRERWPVNDVDRALPTLLGDFVVADDDDHDSPASLLDVATGAERRVLPSGNVCLVDGHLVLTRRRERVRAVVSLAWPDGHDDLWIVDGAPTGGWIAAGQVLIVDHSSGPVALDRATGSKRWSGPSTSCVMGDGRGVLLLGAGRRGLLRPAEGSNAPSVDIPLEPYERPEILFPDRLLTIVQRKERRRPVQSLYTYDRTDGARRLIAEIPLEPEQVGAAWVGSREVIYHGHGEEVEAFSAEGERLWSTSVGAEGEHVTQLASYPGRLYVATDRSILCLEEGPPG